MPTYISLGGNCAIAYWLKFYNLRTEAYPFDWCDIPFNKLIKVLLSDFDDYHNITDYGYSENHKSNMYKNSYNIRFAHETINSETILRRIRRFCASEANTSEADTSEVSETETVFVRLELDNKPHNYEYLLSLLSKYKRDCKLIVLGNHPISEHERITYIPIQMEEDWRFPNVDWKSLFF